MFGFRVTNLQRLGLRLLIKGFGRSGAESRVQVLGVWGFAVSSRGFDTLLELLRPNIPIIPEVSGPFS